MELRVLSYFLAVVQAKNISRAARQLHVSQPTVSRQLQDLEDELGVSLFERGSREIILTPDGQYLTHQAEQITDLVDKTLSNIHRAKTISGTVVIGSGEAQMMRTVARTINTLKHDHPGVQVNLYSTNGDTVTERLQTGVFDFGIVMSPLMSDRYDFIRLPGVSRWGVLVPRSSTIASHSTIDAATLTKLDLIVPQQKGVNTLFEDWLGHSTANFKVVSTYNLLYNASMLVSAGVGAALCLDGIINTDHTALTFVPLAPGLVSTASLVWLKGRPLSAAANAFLKQLTTDISLVTSESDTK
ncbi:LysR family transcriptional regulator [Lactiplantibacillus dongliensis]|uniref:LysR family transcriptional regulator n=1 Tax=Lactiplantibacillus dongliensis TaxID=2559919 RepID=A0ABW1R5R1_9LACO|nr:LysR family transcriptional regulator [Lactiplantibacillus dongliensis]